MEAREIRELEQRMRKMLAGDVENRLTAQGCLADLEEAGLIERSGEWRDGLPVYVATDRGRALRDAQDHLEVTMLFGTLVEAVEDEFDLDHEQAVAFIKEACKAGGMPRREEEPELVEELRQAVTTPAPDPEPPPF